MKRVLKWSGLGEMHLCETIRTMRNCGVCTASIVEANNASLEDVANRFGLNNDCSIYHEIDSTQATRALTMILHKDMAYETEIMPIHDASELANEFILSFDSKITTFFTNGSCGETTYTGHPNSAGWNPATDATFDTGVMAISPSKIGCLWIEDED